MKPLLSILFWLLPYGLLAQDPREALFDHYTIQKPSLGRVTIHVSKTDDPARTKPMLLYLDGSGNMPIFYRKKTGQYRTSVPLDIKRYINDYHVVLISKPGVPLFDSLHYTPAGQEYYPTNGQYRALYSLDWRAESASEAINLVLRKRPVDRNRVIVMGYSEGSQVAPRDAVFNKRVTHVACFVGNALNQFYDFLLNARLRVEKNEITADVGQQLVDSLYTEYAKIYQSPKDTTRRWYGATYRKWGSFCAVTPLESMLTLSIPILYVAGGRDRNQTIFDMDYAKLEFLRRGKTNLTYKVYPNGNHFLQEEKMVNGKVEQLDRLDEAQQFALDWVNQAK